MALVYLIRHGENDYVKQNRVAGRTPGVHLNQKGLDQAQRLVGPLRTLKPSAIYSSPLERAIETAEPTAEVLEKQIQIRPELLEMDYGDWQGQSIPGLKKKALWKSVQTRPSRVTFPGGESFIDAQFRLVKFIESICQDGKPSDIFLCFTHADLIKLAISAFIGLSLDSFQHLIIHTGSISILEIQETSAGLVLMNSVPNSLP